PNWTGAETLCCGQWSADGKYFFFVGGSKNSPGSLWVVREPHGLFHGQDLPIRLSTDPLPVSVLLPSADGKKIYLLGNNLKTEYGRAALRSGEIHGLLGGKNAACLASSHLGVGAFFRGSANPLWRPNLEGSAGVKLENKKMQAALPAVRP